MTTGEKIKFLRLRNGWTREELGQKVGVQRAAINKYEKGTVVNIKRETMAKLGDALGVSAVDLLDDDSSIIFGEGYGDGYLSFELEPITKELVEKVKQLNAVNQRMVMNLVEDLLEIQEGK